MAAGPLGQHVLDIQQEGSEGSSLKNCAALVINVLNHVPSFSSVTVSESFEHLSSF